MATIILLRFSILNVLVLTAPNSVHPLLLFSGPTRQQQVDFVLSDTGLDSATEETFSEVFIQPLEKAIEKVENVSISIYQGVDGIVVGAEEVLKTGVEEVESIPGKIAEGGRIIW